MLPPASKSTHRPDAFTLVELLCVIAIIGILAAIIIPVSARVRESANASKCQSNLRQLHSATMGFSADRNHLPYYNTSDAVTYQPDEISRMRSWYTNIFFYLNLPKDTGNAAIGSYLWSNDTKVIDVFLCPSDSRKWMPNPTLNGGLLRPSYGMINSLGLNQNDPGGGYKLSEIRNNIILLMDAKDFAISPGPTTSKYYFRPRHNCPTGYDPDNPDNTDSTDRGGKGHAIYLDGSIRTFTRTTLPAYTSTSPDWVPDK